MENSQKNKGKALVGALLLGLAVVGSAFTKAPELKQNEVMFGRDQNGNWVQLTSAQHDLPCFEDPNVCKAVYEEGYTPVTGTSADPGFVRDDGHKGYIVLP